MSQPPCCAVEEFRRPTTYCRSESTADAVQGLAGGPRVYDTESNSSISGLRPAKDLDPSPFISSLITDYPAQRCVRGVGDAYL